jgi:thymidylate synthase (FAD)
MKLIKPSTEILSTIDGDVVLKTIEQVARTCYKSEDLITDDSAKKMVSNLLKNGHEAMIEFYDITVKFVCDRGVSHEIVRHRVASYAQESTRYCNYSKDKFGNELSFIHNDIDDMDNAGSVDYANALETIELAYFQLIKDGVAPQMARAILPNSLKTEINVKMNLREWRHFFSLRCAPAAHPQMRELTIPLLEKMHNLVPIIFNDLYNKFINKNNNE